VVVSLRKNIRKGINDEPETAVEDRHGLALSGHSTTPLHLAVSVYGPEGGEPLPVSGGSFIELGTLASW